MVRIYSLLLMFVLMLVYTGCEEDIFIKGDYRQKYILNGIVSGDDSTQIVSLLKSYNVEGLDPGTSLENTFLTGAFVRMWYRDTVYILRDTVVVGTDSRGNEVSKNLYYTNGFKPSYGETVEIEALLDNGRRLKSSTTLPNRVTFPLSEKSPTEPERQIPGNYEGDVVISWMSSSNNQFYRPKYRLVYDKYFGYDETRRYYEVPQDYVLRDNEYIAVPAKIGQGTGGRVALDAINRAMLLLSEGYPVKTDYRIFYLEVEVTVLDQYLAAYYSSSGNLGDEYSISLDKVDYTNVNGGLGIFGSKIKQKFIFYIETNYIHSFGYIPFYN